MRNLKRNSWSEDGHTKHGQITRRESLTPADGPEFGENPPKALSVEDQQKILDIVERQQESRDKLLARQKKQEGIKNNFHRVSQPSKPRAKQCINGSTQGSPSLWRSRG